MTKFFALTIILTIITSLNIRKINAQESDLTGKKWVVTELAKGVPVNITEGLTAPFIIFGDENKINGNASCNNLIGSYESDGKHKMKITAATTRKMCPDMKIEDALLQALEKTNNYIISGNTLMLQSGKMLLAKFEGVPLEVSINNKWELFELVGKPVDKGSMNETFTLTFLEDNKVQAKVCNSMNGTYKTNNDNALKINIEISTMLACPELETELLIKDALILAGEYAIEDNNTLILKNGRVILAKFRLADN
ncbi:MAG: META domain-containing protein [Ignavibacteria bacterium]